MAGIGNETAQVGANVAVVRWFNPRSHAVAMIIMNSIGKIGAIASSNVSPRVAEGVDY